MPCFNNAVQTAAHVAIPGIAFDFYVRVLFATPHNPTLLKLKYLQYITAPTLDRQGTRHNFKSPTMASSFRRINVDQYDEDHGIQPDELVPEHPLSDNELISAVQSISQQVRAFLQRGDTQSALAAVLCVEPYGSSPALAQAKVAAF